MPNITKRGNNYRIKVFAGYDAEGRQIVRSCTFKPDPSKTDRQNKKALEVFAIEFEQKVLSGKLLDGEHMTFRQYIENVWLPEYAEKQLAKTSYEEARRSLTRVIIPALGHLKLSQIQPLHIQKLYDDMTANGYEKHGKHYKYSTTTIKRYHAVLSGCLKQAVYWQLIDENPCRRIRPPKLERKQEVKAFTLEEAQAFLSYLEEPYTVTSRGRAKKDGEPSDEHEEVRRVPLQLTAFFIWRCSADSAEGN